ncbi:hypothetical protein C8E87_6853 [Paractinoplanes brasiliensis]|uniref:ABC-2 family transporter n=2 Tax=Paractinoplanes brasiliensis TaxID=52695 RepID=A0A4R6J7E3_9ACTN|nr:hypothetical protein C8E87_6853 [Actinoplanes brasiliensis]GID30825.1 hypothetical protein Abr02nite_58080 [Actinoplanes brasiliensis]
MIGAELRKLLGLPTAWVGLVLGLIAAPALVFVNAPALRRQADAGRLLDTADLGYHNLGIGLLGALILGVVTVSSEYTSTGDDAPGARQMTSTLLAMPSRHRLLAAKGVALTLVVAAQGTLTAAATVWLTGLVMPGLAPPFSPVRVGAAVLYWVLLALLAYAITLIFRNGIITLTLFIANSAVVSVSYLLTKLTPLAAYLPDIVGAHMFLRSHPDAVTIPPLTAGLVMTTWVAALLAVALFVFHRRAA